MDSPQVALQKVKDALGYASGTISLRDITAPSGYSTYAWHVESVTIGDSYDPSIWITYRFTNGCDYYPISRACDEVEREIKKRVSGATDRSVCLSVKF